MKKQPLLIALLAIYTSLATESHAATPEEDRWQKHIEQHGNFIVEFAANTRMDERRLLVEHVGGRATHEYRSMPAMAARLSDWEADALRKNPQVRSVIPNRPMHKIGKPDTSEKSSVQTTGEIMPAGVARIGGGIAPETGQGIGVAVVDTGIDFLHPDLAGHVSPDCFSAYGSDCRDDDGHGTHVAGIIGAIDNEIDVIGVAPNASLYSVKVLDANGEGSDASVMAGLDWIYRQGNSLRPTIRVVNLSLGRTGTVDDNPGLHAAISALTELGINLTAAAGNDPAQEIWQQIPAGYPEVMAIASTTAKNGASLCRSRKTPIASDTASAFTTDGAQITISAPGEDREDISRGCSIVPAGILSTRLGGGTTRMYGTSMAAPHVAGVVALILEAAEGKIVTPATVRTLLANTAELRGAAPLSSPSRAYSFDGIREGLVNATAAAAESSLLP